MTIKEFINTIHDYYGMKYKPGALPFIVDYLEKQPFELKEILKETFLVFTGEYKTLPNIATFEKIIKEKKQHVKDYMPRVEDETVRKSFGLKPINKQIEE